MRNSISKTVFTSAAALAIGLAMLGAIAPASADVYSGRNGQTPGAFSGNGEVVVGGSPARAAHESFMAFYGAANQPASQCYDMTQLRQKAGNTGYSAIERC
jgi:hypothetical protein